MLTIGIFSFYIAGSASEAAALGVILIVVASISVVLINRIAGTRMGGCSGSASEGLLAAMEDGGHRSIRCMDKPL